MKSAVIVFPASNCDRDAADALERVTGERPAMVWHKETALPAGLDLVVLPGGFSFGDYLRAGAMAARSPVMRAVQGHAERGGLVLGICNGFQALTEAGLLPGALLRNAGLKFVCRTVPLAIANSNTRFTRAYRETRAAAFPVAHGDGR
jgi:phosphoribosylformylglycinamidine synthase